MDFKKVLDQTVRDIKREINIKVLKVPEIEQKVMDATCNEPWGPHGTVMADIAHATRNYYDCQMIMGVLWKRVSDTGANWRHVYKALTLLEYIVAHGSERVIDEIVEHSYQISSLADFQYVEPNGKDQGINVRKKSQTLMALVNDKDKIQEVRQKALDNRDKYRGVSSTGGIYNKPSAYHSAGGSYSSDQYGQDSRYGSRDDDDDGYGRDKYKEDARDHTVRDGDKDRSAGGRDGDYVEEDESVFRHPNSVNPSGKHAAANNVPDDFDDFNPRASSSIPQGSAATLQLEDLLFSEPTGAARGSPPSLSLPDATDSTTTSAVRSTLLHELDGEDFGAFSSATGVADDVITKGATLGHSAVTANNVAEATAFSSSAAAAASFAIKPPPTYVPPTHKAHCSAALVGAVPAAVTTTNGASFNTMLSTPSMSSPPAFGGDDLLGLESFGGVSTFSLSSAASSQESLSKNVSSASLQQGVAPANWAFPASVSNANNNSMRLSASFQAPSLSSHANTNSQPQKKFETKSTIWADSISKGLIDLNITAPKSNSLAGIGVDFDLLRTEGAKEERAAPGMGIAMGSGSGLGVAGASAIVHPATMSSTMGKASTMGVGMDAAWPPMVQTSMNSVMAMRPGRGMTSAGFSNQQQQLSGFK